MEPLTSYTGLRPYWVYQRRAFPGVWETVGGHVSEHPEWVWTIQGNWYRQSDGRRIDYRKAGEVHAMGKVEEVWEHVPMEDASGWDLDPATGVEADPELRASLDAYNAKRAHERN